MEIYKSETLGIEAVVFRRQDWEKIVEFTNGKAEDLKVERSPNGKAYCVVSNLESNQVATEGDYIIKDKNGECFTCSPTTLLLAYEILINKLEKEKENA